MEARISDSCCPEIDRQLVEYKGNSIALHQVNVVVKGIHFIWCDISYRMDFEVTDKVVIISPEIEYFKIDELPNKDNPEKTDLNNDIEDVSVESEMDKIYESFIKGLSIHRVECRDRRSHAIWDEERGSARVTRKNGKFYYGYQIGEHHYLEYYETLFLIEMNRLQLMYKSTLVSIEMAYILLLGEAYSHKYQVYLVYSYLTRMGYEISKHMHRINIPKQRILGEVKNKTSKVLSYSAKRQRLHDTEKEDDTRNYHQECEVKAENSVKPTPILVNDVPSTETCGDSIKDSPSYNSDKHNAFQSKTNPVECEETSNRWRVEISEINIKSQQSGKEVRNTSIENAQNESIISLHSTKNDYYKCFREDFEKFNMMAVKSYRSRMAYENLVNDIEYLNINFDVYLRRRKRRITKNRPDPLYHVIISNPDEQFLQTDILYACEKCQPNCIPMLYVKVNDQDNLQFFTLGCS